MVIIVVCSVLLAAGVAVTVRSGSLPLQAPGPLIEAGAPLGAVARRYLWWNGVAFYTGIASGMLVVGPSARLIMRILAVTSGPTARGRRTEAGEIVGRISLEGTVGLFVFVGLLGGTATALLYVLVRRWLPPGRLGGLAFGVFLLLAASARLEPLRPRNPDFDIAGPGWLSIVLFGSSILLQGLALPAFAGLVSRWLPEPHGSVGGVLSYLPLLLLAPSGLVFIVLVLLLGLTLLATRSSGVVAAFRAGVVRRAGTLALIIVAVASLPGTITALRSIASRP